MQTTAQSDPPVHVLGIDSALAACSVALLVEGKPVARRFAAMARGHAETLLPMIAAAMAEARTGFAALDLIAVTVGPGHFTGLRVGLAAAQGLAVSWDRPLAGVTTLEAVAAAADPAGAPLAVALETKRADLYVQVFRDGNALTAPLSLPPDRFALGPPWPDGDLALAGDGAPRLAAALRAAGRAVRIVGPDLPDAAIVAVIAARRNGTASALAAAPLYLRPPDVTLPKARAR